LTKAMALELAQFGIRVKAVAAGVLAKLQVGGDDSPASVRDVVTEIFFHRIRIPKIVLVSELQSSFFFGYVTRIPWILAII